MEEKQFEVKQVSEREIWVGESKVKLGEDGILYQSFVGDFDAKLSLAINDAAFKLIKRAEGNVNTIVDLTRAGKSTSEARKLGKEGYESGTFGKVALYGAHPVAGIIARFFMSIFNKKNLSFFKTKEEALAWLKE